MKKIMSIVFLLIGSVFLFVGCGTNLMNTPTKKVETLFNNYITLDKKVLDDLDETMLSETIMNNTQKDEYREIMKKQYQNMSYEIKDETIDGDLATVETEIEVYNYKKVIDNVNTYLENNKNEFLTSENTVDTNKFNDYKLKELKNTKDKVTYTLNLTLKKVNDTWVLDNLTDTEISKIHGMYEY